MKSESELRGTTDTRVYLLYLASTDGDTRQRRRVTSHWHAMHAEARARATVPVRPRPPPRALASVGVWVWARSEVARIRRGISIMPTASQCCWHAYASVAVAVAGPSLASDRRAKPET
jgi:hypothetical protein